MIIGSISRTGIVIQAHMTKSNINKKIEQHNFAFTSCQKILTQIRSYLQGLPYDTEFEMNSNFPCVGLHDVK